MERQMGDETFWMLLGVCLFLGFRRPGKRAVRLFHVSSRLVNVSWLFLLVWKFVILSFCL
jgi:hypothetical protein